MAGTSAGSTVAWLFILPLGSMFIIALVMNLFVVPFNDSPPVLDSTGTTLSLVTHTVLTGGIYPGLNISVSIPVLGSINIDPIFTIINPITWVYVLLPAGVGTFVNAQIDVIFYLPTAILYPYIILCDIAILIGEFVLLTMLIP